MHHWNVVADLVHVGAWYKNKGIVTLNLCLIVPLLTAIINGFDSSVLNGLQISHDFQSFFHPSETLRGLMLAAQNIGAVVALPLTPIASDRLGRRRALFLGSCIMLGGVALQVIAHNIQTLIGARAIIGFGLCFATNAGPLLITELAYPTQRGQITSMYNSSWYLGSIIAAWITFGTIEKLGGTPWAWRIPSLVQAIPCVIQIILVWFIPESPRWLIAKGRDLEAIRVLGKYHANGDEKDPLVMFEYTQIRQALRMEHEIARTSFWYLFKTPGNRRRMLIVIAIGLFSQWSGNGLGSYYLAGVLQLIGITSQTTASVINGSLQIWNLVVAVCAALLVDRIGRRTLFLASNIGMFLVFVFWTLTTALFETQQNQVAARAAIPLIFLFYMFYDIAYTPLLVAYSIEILPFNIRAKGFAVMNLTVVLTLAFNQLVNPPALRQIQWKYYLFYCAWLVLELVFVYIFVVETKGRTLEETAAIFDGQEKMDDLQHIASVVATQSLAARGEEFQLRHRAPPQKVSLAEKSRQMPSSDDLQSIAERHEEALVSDKDSLAGLGLRPSYTP